MRRPITVRKHTRRTKSGVTNVVKHQREIEKVAPKVEQVEKVPFEIGNKLFEKYSDRMMRDHAQLMSDDSNEIQGHRDGLPYWLEAGGLSFDGNANSEQEYMNKSMKRIMDDLGLTFEDLDLDFAWNADSDSYLSFVSSEADMPKNSLPIFHGGDSGEHEDQIESVEDEYERNGGKKTGMTLKQFEKFLDDDLYRKGDLIYSPVQFSYVVYTDKNKFLSKVKQLAKEQGKTLSEEDLKTIENYEG